MYKSDDLHGIWKKYEKNQWENLYTIKKIQHLKLVHILMYCMTSVPYYRNVFKSKKIRLEDLNEFSVFKTIPLLDKGIIRRHFNELQAENIPRWRIRESSTSGSTGESLFFNADVASAKMHMVAKFRNFSWCGVTPFDKQAVLWGARFDNHAVKNVSDKFRAWARPILFLSSYQMTESNMDKYYNNLCEYRPLLLTSYPSPLERFAEFCQKYELRVPSLHAIICSAEQLSDSQRYLFQNVFKVPVFNRYGCREFGCVAHECEQHHGLHVNMERVFVEVLRADGTDCDQGEIGEIVITDLDNKVMPFIRYRSGDLGSWTERMCDCGRCLEMLDKIEGRVFDLVYTPSGSSISGTFWTLLLKHISSDVLGVQIRQDVIEKITIIIKMRNRSVLKYDQIVLLHSEMKKIAPDLLFDIRYVDDIPVTISGKKKFVIGLKH